MIIFTIRVVSHWFKQNQVNMQCGKVVYHMDGDSVFI